MSPSYYVLFGMKRFASVEAMCSSCGLPLELVTPPVNKAMAEGAELAVVPQLTMGPPEDMASLVVRICPEGDVEQCLGVLGEQFPTEELAGAKAQEWIDGFAAHGEAFNVYVASVTFGSARKLQ